MSRLDLVHERVHFAFVFVNPPDHFGASLDHLPQNIFLMDDLGVLADVKRRDAFVRQRGKVGKTTDTIELLLVLQLLLQRDIRFIGCLHSYISMIAWKMPWCRKS